MEKMTQLSIEMAVKNGLDRFKAENKEVILERYKDLKRKRLVTNGDAIRFLLDNAVEPVGAKQPKTGTWIIEKKKSKGV